MTERDVNIPFAIRLPANWAAVDPAESGAPDAVLAAKREGPATAFATNVIVSMRHVRGEVDLLDLADAAAGRLATQVDDLTVADRTVLDDREFPAAAQVLRVRASSLELIQSQVHLVVPITTAPDGDKLVVELACTCPADAGGDVRDEFAAIVDSFSVRPEAAGSDGTGPDGTGPDGTGPDGTGAEPA